MGQNRDSDTALDRADEQLLTMNEACAMLGVDQTTLRRWSDAGRIPVFRTVGGHRRYRESDVQALIDQHSQGGTRVARPSSSSPSPVTPQAHTITMPQMPAFQAEYLQGARDRQWFSAFDSASLLKLRGLGRDLVELAMRYASLNEDRGALIAEGQRIGIIYGQQAQNAGLTGAETVEAFLYFRFPVIFAAGNLIEGVNMPADRVTRVFSDINQFMDRVLLATVRAREDADRTR